MRLGVKPLEVSVSPPSAEARVGCVSKCPSPSTLLHTRTLISFSLVLPILLLTPGLAQAQTASPASADIQRERVEQLTELLRTKKDLQASQQAMQQQLAEFDARIAALEASLGVTPSQDERPQGESEAIASTAAASTAALASPGGRSLLNPGTNEVPLRKSWGFPTNPL